MGHLFESLCHSLYHGRLRLVRQIGGKCLPCCETEKHSPIVAQKKRERSALSPVVNLIMQPPQQQQQQRAVRLRTDAAVPRCGWKAGLSPPSWKLHILQSRLCARFKCSQTACKTNISEPRRQYRALLTHSHSSVWPCSIWTPARPGDTISIFPRGLQCMAACLYMEFKTHWISPSWST